MSRPRDNAARFSLRAERPGDIGWVIHRHGVLYAEEYGWNSMFEGLVAEVAGQFLQNRDPERERCWIAERDGAIAGSVFLARSHDPAAGSGGSDIAKLRLLYVEPSARGLGIGKRLVETCIDAARELRYSGITLWTTSNLHSARRIYESFGFELESEEPFDTFGPQLVGQHWTLSFNG